MDTGEQVIAYLEEVATVLCDLHVDVPFHMLIMGGAYMLLQKQRRSTKDIDFALIVPPPSKVESNKPFHTRVLQTELSRRAGSVPFTTEFKQAVEIIARRHRLPPDWLNDEAATYYYDDAPDAEMLFWRSFDNILYVYLPTSEYIFATKIMAYRPKDAKDIQRLTQILNIHTQRQAQTIVDKFLLADAQEFWEVEKKLQELFP